MDLCLRISIPCFKRSWCNTRPNFICNRFRSRASSSLNFRGLPLLNTGGGNPWSWASLITDMRRAWAIALCSRFTCRDSSASMGCAGPVFFLASTPQSTRVLINVVMALFIQDFFRHTLKVWTRFLYISRRSLSSFACKICTNLLWVALDMATIKVRMPQPRPCQSRTAKCSSRMVRPWMLA